MKGDPSKHELRHHDIRWEINIYRVLLGTNGCSENNRRERERKRNKTGKRHSLWTLVLNLLWEFAMFSFPPLSHFINTSFTFFILLLPCLYSKTSSTLFPHRSETFPDLTLLFDPHPDLLLSPSTTRLVESGLLSVTAHSSSRQLRFGFCPQHPMKLFGPTSWKMTFTGNDPC